MYISLDFFCLIWLICSFININLFCYNEENCSVQGKTSTFDIYSYIRLNKNRNITPLYDYVGIW